MKAQQFSISLSDSAHPVSQAVNSGRIVRVDNISTITTWQPYPLLPDALSQIVVPIVIDGQQMGVIDVLENKVNGLGATDAALLRSLANQVAIAIRNARLFAEVERALQDAFAAQARYTDEAWHHLRRTAPYIYSLSDVPPLPASTLAQTKRKAFGLSQTTILNQYGNNNDDAPDHATLAAPVKLGDHKIGTFQLHRTDVDKEEQVWTSDDLALIEAVLDQVAQTAENLRLFEETRQRASREQLARQITDRIRSSRDLEMAMNVAAQELSDALDLSKAKIKWTLQPDEAPTQTTGEAANGADNGQTKLLDT
jgi:GAF domain-containing protein